MAPSAVQDHVYFGRDLQAEALARSDTVGALLARRDHMNQRLSFREMVYLLLADPSSGPLARAFGVLMWIVITLSCFCFMYETMRWVTDLTGPLPWLYAKMTFQIFYTAEACARLLSFVPFRQAYKDAFVWLDVLTAIPFWMRFFLYPDSLTAESYLDNTARSMTVRVFESLAMIRLLKLVKYYEGSILIARAIMKSVTQLLVPLFMLFAMVMFFSMVMYDLEYDGLVEECTKQWRVRGILTDFFSANPGGIAWDCDSCDIASEASEQNSTAFQRCLTCAGYPPGYPQCLGVAFEQTFRDLPAAMWYTMVTVTTVGYGDISPRTWRGQLFGAFVIMFGLIFLAMPLAIVGNNFAKTFEEKNLVKLQRRIRVLLVENGISAADVVIAFRQVDDNGDGLISYREFIEFCKATLRITLPKSDLYALWRQLDINNSGVINFAEFTSVIFPHVNIDALAEHAMSAGEIRKLNEEAMEDDDAMDGQHRSSQAEAPAAGSRSASLGQKMAASQAGDRTASTGDAKVGATLDTLLASIERLREAVDSTSARVSAIEAGQVALASRFDAVDALVLARQQRAREKRAEAGDEGEPTKDAPPTETTRRRHHTRHRRHRAEGGAAAATPDAALSAELMS